MDDPTGANPDSPNPHFSWLPQPPSAPAETSLEEIAPLDVRFTDAPAPIEAPMAAVPPAYPGPVYPPAYPMSGPPAVGYPVSAPPISGVPFGYPTTAYPPVPPPKSRRAALVILTILTAMLATATGVMTTLFLLKTDEARQLSQKVSTHESTISTQRHDLEGLNRDIDDVKRQLAGAQDESTQLTTAKNAIAECLTTIYDFWDLLDANKTTEARKKADEVDQVCSEADKYL
jgi:hypothetical protein